MISNDEANKIYNDGLNKVRNTPEPIGQKYPIGTRVMIDNKMPDSMSHFPKGKLATVMYTYAHAYWGNDVKSYCLDVDDIGSVSWYNEYQLSPI